MKSDSFCEEFHRSEFHLDEMNSATSFELALHSTEPYTDDQSSNEIRNPGYSRIPVRRNAESWSVVKRRVSNATTISLPVIRSGTVKVTHVSIGIAGRIRRSIKLQVPIELLPNHRIEFEPGSLVIDETSEL